MKKQSLTIFAWLSIITSLITIGLKVIAYLYTGSVGLLSEVLESCINLVAGFIALIMLKIAEKPADDDHHFGHTKAEYFSSIFEGLLIVAAAFGIGYAAIQRLFHPQSLQQIPAGILFSVLASIANIITATILLKYGKKHNSITLKADAHHLLTDVWTSAGVIIAVALVGITNIQVLDPLVAILVSLNIIYTGFQLMKESVMGFMDTALSKEDHAIIEAILTKYCKKPIQYHSLLTRQSATRKFISFHVIVPDDWSVKKGHDLVEDIEKEMRLLLQNVHIVSHIEPLHDKRSWEDIGIERV